MYKLAFIILLFAVSSCQNITSSYDFDLGEEFELRFGQQASLDNGELKITFKEVLEDSRCPEGVTCVWAGNAQIFLIVNGSEATLNTYLEPQVRDISGYQIELLSLNPYPVYQQTIEKETYIAKLVVNLNEK
ncbi:MAG: hypothetical protein R3222_03140 [Balneolaceae bacterium]|nr:hypothetical protein [Balneolaceae bacterium]